MSFSKGTSLISVGNSTETVDIVVCGTQKRTTEISKSSYTDVARRGPN